MSNALYRVESIHGIRVAGWLLIVLPFLSMLVLAHHPTIAAHDARDAVRQLGAIATLASVVHGLLIAMQCAMLYALLTWLMLRDFTRSLPRAAAVMLLLGAVGVVGAALVDGFLVAPLAAYPQEGDGSLVVMDKLIRYSMSLNQLLILAGESAMSVGFILLSLDLVGVRGGARWVGVFGFLLGSTSLVGLLTGRLLLHLHGMQLLFAAQSLWMISLGLLMLRSNGGPVHEGDGESLALVAHGG